MSDRCGNCSHARTAHSDYYGCMFTDYSLGRNCSCHEFRKQITLELRRCATCGHPKFAHYKGGGCGTPTLTRHCDCTEFVDRPAWRDSMQSWERDTEKEKPMTDDRFVPLAEDVRHASRVLKALGRQDIFTGHHGYTAQELWDRAEDMERQVEADRRKRDKLFQLASDITVGGSRGEGGWLNVYKVAEFLLEQGWDKTDTEAAT